MVHPDIKEHSQNWQIKEANFLGRINNAFIDTIDDLEKLLKGTSKNSCKI